MKVLNKSCKNIYTNKHQQNSKYSGFKEIDLIKIIPVITNQNTVFNEQTNLWNKIYT